jgi:hypothetical protein
MRLSLEDGTILQDPNAEQIDLSLRSLNWARDNSFAILGEDQSYIQTAHIDDPEVAEDAPYHALEYQEGSLDEHYEATGQGLSLERIIDAFQRYARGDPSWREMFTWQKMTF